MNINKKFKHDHVISSLKEAYSFMVKNKTVIYKGPLLTSSYILDVSLNIDERIKTYKYQKKEHNKTPLDIILSCAFQLGIQQGINKCVENPGTLEIEEKDKKRFKRAIESYLMTNDEIEEMFKRLDIFKNKK